jgi:hypothetical protein
VFFLRIQNGIGTGIQSRVGHKKLLGKSRVKASERGRSVVEKSDDYDDGNWHAKQPKQYRAAPERLLFCFRF